jgi:hypothetical protein
MINHGNGVLIDRKGKVVPAPIYNWEVDHRLLLELPMEGE